VTCRRRRRRSRFLRASKDLRGALAPLAKLSAMATFVEDVCDRIREILR